MRPRNKISDSTSTTQVSTSAQRAPANAASPTLLADGSADSRTGTSAPATRSINRQKRSARFRNIRKEHLSPPHLPPADDSQMAIRQQSSRHPREEP